MAKIYAPNKAYTGVSASVPFTNGVGESSNPALLGWFQEHGYKVVDPEVVTPTPVPAVPTPPEAEETVKEVAPVEAKKPGQKGAKHA